MLEYDGLFDLKPFTYITGSERGVLVVVEEKQNARLISRHDHLDCFAGKTALDGDKSKIVDPAQDSVLCLVVVVWL